MPLVFYVARLLAASPRCPFFSYVGWSAYRVKIEEGWKTGRKREED